MAAGAMHIVAETAEILRGRFHLIPVDQIHFRRFACLHVGIFRVQVFTLIDTRTSFEDAFCPVHTYRTEVEMGIEVMVRHKLQKVLPVFLSFRCMGEEHKATSRLYGCIGLFRLLHSFII